MCAVGADGELQLQQQLVGVDGIAVEQLVAPVAQLAAELRELAGPESEHGGLAAVGEVVEVGVVGDLVAAAGEPALGELPLAGDEPAERRGIRARLLAAAADRLGPRGERAVGGGLQRLPAQCGVESGEASLAVLEERARLAGR